MLILSFGMLGVAGLLVSGVSNAASSEAMGKATQLANEMADRIRANSAVALSASSEYSIAYGASAPTGTTVARKDVAEWRDAIAAQLPSGSGAITVDVAGGARKVTIKVRWNNCLGILNDTETAGCKNQTGTSLYKEVIYEMRL